MYLHSCPLKMQLYTKQIKLLQTLYKQLVCTTFVLVREMKQTSQQNN